MSQVYCIRNEVGGGYEYYLLDEDGKTWWRYEPELHQWTLYCDDADALPFSFKNKKKVSDEKFAKVFGKSPLSASFVE